MMKENKTHLGEKKSAHIAGAKTAGDTVILPLEKAEQMMEHARRTYPEECCGILLGKRGSVSVISAARPTANLRTTRVHDRYEMDPREILRADRAAEKEGKEILGFYHSHPDHPPVPSPTDAEYAWSGYVYLIIAVKAGQETETKAWIYDEALRKFHEYSIKYVQENKEIRAGIHR